MNLGLEGRIAVVAGGSRGIGFAIAEALVREGAKVAIGARTADSLETAVAALRKAKRGAEVLALPLDVLDPNSVAAFAERVRGKLGDASVLVSNAGGPPSGSFDEIEPTLYSKALDLCLLSAVRLFQEFLPAMRRHKYGRIVHVASVSARQPLDGLVLSNTARAAVLGFAKSVANQVARDAVTVNVVLPGFTRTERMLELANDAAQRTGKPADEILAGYLAQTPMRRLAEPAEIADVVTFLCSERAGFVTGTSLAVDGGFIRGLP
jgi:3-oxoacyl-[acyl-carrier protein] reductase